MRMSVGLVIRNCPDYANVTRLGVLNCTVLAERYWYRIEISICNSDELVGRRT